MLAENVFTIGGGHSHVLRPTGNSFTPPGRLWVWFCIDLHRGRRDQGWPFYTATLRRGGFLVLERWCPAHCRRVM